MTTANQRRRGAPIGNQNARKHGFYSKVLTPGQRKLLPALAGMRGLDGEIEYARARIVSILANDPNNIKVLIMALSALTRLVRCQDAIDNRVRKDAQNATKTLAKFLDRLEKGA